MIKIALDMMGGDNAPSSNIGGVVEFLSESSNSAKIYLVGKSDVISKEIVKNSNTTDFKIKYDRKSDKVCVDF